jgi:hypothetical protein
LLSYKDSINSPYAAVSDSTLTKLFGNLNYCLGSSINMTTVVIAGACAVVVVLIGGIVLTIILVKKANAKKLKSQMVIGSTNITQGNPILSQQMVMQFPQPMFY